MPSASDPLLMRGESIARPYSADSSFSGNRSSACSCEGSQCSNRRHVQHQAIPHSLDAIISTAPKLNSKKLDPNSVGASPTFWDVLPYYLPCFSWLPDYTWVKFGGDLVAGISLASFQIPLALSYATSLAHVEPLCGLYSLAFTPFLYAIFGSVPQMIVGPESAISLVVGQAVEKLTSHNSDLNVMDISVTITFISGGFLFFFGICRFGFLGNVLSRALLRGFISSVGLVMIVNALITELKLNKLLEETTGHYHTPFHKLIFISKYGPENYHKPTAILSFSCFAILMFIRIVKKRLMKKKRWPVFIPEILISIIVLILLSSKLKFKQKYNISIVGDFNTKGFDKLNNPLSKSNRELIPNLMSAGFITAMLGFFESTTASKSLGSAYDLAISSNRELVALGSMNLFASLFGALPSFGGYGRSKINAFSGAQTVMSGAIMGIIVLLTIWFLLSLIRYIPVCILSVVTTIVGISLLEEAPADLRFHISCRGYDELLVFAVTVFTTFFYSVEMGICIGCGYSIISIIKHSAKSRIQILARIENTTQFINSDDYLRNASAQNLPALPDLEELEGCLVVKVPEPLTFTNTEDLKERLNRLERFGSVKVHPGSRGIRTKDSTKYVVFDLNGMTFMDSSAAQIMMEIITSYKRRGVKVFLARVPFDNKIRLRLEASGVTKYVEKTIQKSTLPSIDLVNNNNTQPSPYFTTIEDTLNAVDDIELSNANFEFANDEASVFSSTLFNSNLV